MENTTSASNIGSKQQFCLRWHNHQASLLTSLPLLLDQSHLTDVTLSAEGRTIRAHRVVLSACSSFFSDLFRTLEPPYHPVIVLPGASFAGLVALLTFMYSGEVNVYEEQISILLSLAETLGIKGLADFNGNVSQPSPPETSPKELSPSTETPSPTPTPTKQMSASPLENLFAKPFQFCPNIMAAAAVATGPLNFSQSAISRGAEIFARYQNQCRLNQQIDAIDENDNKRLSDCNKSPPILGAPSSKLTEMRKIDKIAESLRSGSSIKSNCFDGSTKRTAAIQQPSSLILKPPPQFPHNLPHHFLMPDDHQTIAANKTPECLLLEQSQQPSTPNFPGGSVQHERSPTKPSNSKIYATCYICHKQLSNQYNLRVHLETHQNVRYACSVCSHVSRSKDALRKHVSYRHPGAPSPCESETRRKRAKIGITSVNPNSLTVNKLENPAISSPSFAVTNQSTFCTQQQMKLQHQLSGHQTTSPLQQQLSFIKSEFGIDESKTNAPTVQRLLEKTTESMHQSSQSPKQSPTENRTSSPTFRALSPSIQSKQQTNSSPK